MNGWMDGKEWKAGLLGWGVRGTLVALPSGWWAILAGCHRPREVLAMALGTLLWVVIFTTGCSLRVALVTERRRRWLAALRKAAWLKLGWIVLSVPMLLGLAGLGTHASWITLPLVGGVGIDFMTGVGITGFIRQFEHWGPAGIRLAEHSFTWALIATVLQGGAVAAGLVLLAAVVRGIVWLNVQWNFPFRRTGRRIGCGV